ncbi:MAG: thioredoxin domain-containing protein [Hyphomonadaceae bacterium]
MRLNRRTFALGASALALGAPGAAWADSDGDMTIGAETAPVHLFEYASATCPHCAHFHESNWEALKSNYIDAGHVRFTLREMATPPPVVAFGMFQLARCGDATAQEYFRRLAVLFQRQRAILETGSMAGVRDSLLALGGEWGLSPEQVMASLNDEQGADRLTRSIEGANARGVTATPAFFIGDEHITDTAFQRPEGMARILDARLTG